MTTDTAWADVMERLVRADRMSTEDLLIQINDKLDHLISLENVKESV